MNEERFLGQRRGRRVQEWEKNVLAAPVAKERVELSRWLMAWLWALDDGDSRQGVSAWS